MIVSRMISWLNFLMSSLAFYLMVLHISAYSVRCLSSPFSTISRRFVIRTCVGDDILDFSGLLIALATLDTLCWIMSVVVFSWCRCRLFRVVSRIGFSIRVGIRSSFILFVWYLFLVASWSSIFPFHLYIQFDLVSRDGLFMVLREIGSPLKQQSMIESVSTIMNDTMQLNSNSSGPLDIRSGIIQSCVIASTFLIPQQDLPAY